MENLVTMESLEFFKGKRVLVTGHTGFKGSWLCLLLHRLGADVYGYALSPPTNPALYEVAEIDNLVHSFTGDIRDYARLSQVLKETDPEIIIHMAAQPLVRASYADPVETYAVNVMGTVNLFEASRHLENLHVIVNVTTDKCYQNKEWLWGYRENEPLGGYDPYSSSKACSELVTASFRDSFFNTKDTGKPHKISVASARAGNVIGGGDWAADRLIPDFIKSISQGEKVKIRNPHAIRPWQHVLEPLTGYLTLCAKLYVKDGYRYAEAWNFGPQDGAEKDVEWIIRNICTLWGGNATYEVEQTPQPHEANYLKLDSSKSRNLLNWQPRWTIDQALNAIVSWTKAYHRGENMQQVSLKQIEEYLESK